MRLLVIGASGLVGAHLLAEAARRGHAATGTYATRPRPGLVPLDVARMDAVRETVRAAAPDAILLPASLPDVDACERQPEDTRRVNVDGVRNVIEAVGGLPVVYFSSDYVFDGAAGPYRETDVPNPLSEYGRQKLAAERMLLDRGSDLVLRTTGVYGMETPAKNFVLRLVERLRAGERTIVPDDQFGSPTHAADLARASLDLVERRASGIWHASGPAVMSRAAFGALVAEVFGLDAGLLAPVPTAALGQVAPRPLRGGLVIEKLVRALAWSPAAPRDGLVRVRQALAVRA